MGQDETYTGHEVNSVLHHVRSLTLNGNVQLGILAHALAVAIRSTGADPEAVIDTLREVLPTVNLVPLHDA